MQSYTEADTVLTGRCHERRKIANNTWLERRPANDGIEDDDDEIAVRLHDTDVVTYRRDGAISLNTGGWFTVTTKARMNTFSPFGVSSNRGEWQVALRNPDYDSSRYNPANPYWGLTVPYRDHMTWHNGNWHGIPTPDEILDERARRKAIRNEINAFIKSITPDDIVRQFNHPQGDCFMCRFDSDDCLADHVEERYFHLALARRAITDRGYRMPDFILSMILSDAVNYNRVSRHLTDALRKYLNRHLLEGVATR